MRYMTLLFFICTLFTFHFPQYHSRYRLNAQDELKCSRSILITVHAEAKFQSTSLIPGRNNLVYLLWESEFLAPCTTSCSWYIKTIGNFGKIEYIIKNRTKVNTKIIRSLGITDETFSIDVNCAPRNLTYSSMKYVHFQILFRYEVSLEASFSERINHNVFLHQCSQFYCIEDSGLEHLSSFRKYVLIDHTEYLTPLSVKRFITSQLIDVRCKMKFSLMFKLRYSVLYIPYETYSSPKNFRAAKDVKKIIKGYSKSMTSRYVDNHLFLQKSSRVICIFSNFPKKSRVSLSLPLSCSSKNFSTKTFAEFGVNTPRVVLTRKLLACPSSRTLIITCQASTRPVCGRDRNIARRFRVMIYTPHPCLTLNTDFVKFYVVEKVLRPGSVIKVYRTPCFSHYIVTFSIEEVGFPRLYFESDKVILKNEFFFRQATTLTIIASIRKSMSDPVHMNITLIKPYFGYSKKLQVSISKHQMIHENQEINCFDATNPFIETHWTLLFEPSRKKRSAVIIKRDSFYISKYGADGIYYMRCTGIMRYRHMLVRIKKVYKFKFLRRNYQLVHYQDIHLVHFLVLSLTFILIGLLLLGFLKRYVVFENCFEKAKNIGRQFIYGFFAPTRFQ